MHTRSLAYVTPLAFLLLSTCGKSPTAADPVGKAVLVMSSNWTGQYDIWLRDSTDHLIDLTPGTEFFDVSPTWSPDGQHIAFASNRGGNGYFVYLMNPDGSGVKKLSDTANAGPAWSPDGLRIAFVGGTDIWTGNPDGSQFQRLTFGGAISPSWSPDGQKIAFVCYDATPPNAEICTITTAGLDTTNLTNDPGRDYAPQWSPDGQKIAFYSDRSGRFEIYVMNADGSGQVRLTDFFTSSINPTWSPDGRLILFSEDDPNVGTRLYVMNPDGTDQRIIPNTSGAESASFRP